MEAESQEIINDRYKTIAKVYHGKDGGRPAYKTYLDAKAIKPGITLEFVKLAEAKRRANKAGRWCS